jgi:hypothetical protein
MQSYYNALFDPFCSLRWSNIAGKVDAQILRRLSGWTLALQPGLKCNIRIQNTKRLCCIGTLFPCQVTPRDGPHRVMINEVLRALAYPKLHLAAKRDRAPFLRGDRPLV